MPLYGQTILNWQSVYAHIRALLLVRSADWIAGFCAIGSLACATRAKNRAPPLLKEK
jgi:hypothetical protein